MFGTIQQLHHFIRTAFGNSDCSFTGTTMPMLLQGVGQGNGAGPQIRAAVSSPIFDMVCNLGNGTTLQSLLTQDRVHFVGFGFVDDVDLIATDNTTSRSPACILQQLQQTLDLWETGLRTSGRALSAKKSHWTFIEFTWKKGKWVYKSTNELPGTLLMNNVTGSWISLDRLEPHKAEHSLGLRIAPDGNSAAELQFRKEQTLLWASQLIHSKIP